MQIKRSVLVLLILEAIDLTMTIWLVNFLGYIQQSWMAVAYGLWAVTAFKLVCTIGLAVLLQKVDFGKWAWVFPSLIGLYVSMNMVAFVVGLA